MSFFKYVIHFLIIFVSFQQLTVKAQDIPKLEAEMDLALESGSGAAASGFSATGLLVSLVASQLNGDAAAIVNGGISAYNYKICYASNHTDMMSCYVAATSAAAAIGALKNKDDHDKPIDALKEPTPDTGYNNDSTYGSTPPALKSLANTIANIPGVDRKQMEKIQYGSLSKLQSMGYNINSKGNLVDPSGKEYPISSLSSASSMKAAGFSDADIAKMEDAKAAAAQIKDQLYKKYGLSNDSFEAQAAARVAAYSNAASAASGGAWNLNALLGGAAVKAKKATGVGLEKNIAGGQSIGVAADNIFEMINRTYNSEKSNLSGPMAIEPRAPTSYKYNP